MEYLTVRNKKTGELHIVVEVVATFGVLYIANDYVNSVRAYAEIDFWIHFERTQ